jgi:menaquinol-cytochrome c reductase iron-sulfur subunit
VADPISRRKFLRRATLVMGGVIVAGWAVPAVAYVLGPARSSDRIREWRPLGSPDKVEVGTPTLFKTRVERTTGWVTQEEEVSVYVFTEDGRNYAGLSNICTHLGCRVRWVDDQDSFFCPCHNATFAKDGRVASGPPPRPLDPYEIKLEDEQLFVNLEI